MLIKDFFSAVRFISGVVGTMLLGGALEMMTRGFSVNRIAYVIGLGLVGVVLFDPRGRWLAFFAVLIGSFGLVGLTGIFESLTAESRVGGVSWHDMNIWRVIVYAACLVGFFIWSARIKKLGSN